MYTAACVSVCVSMHGVGGGGGGGVCVYILVAPSADVDPGALPAQPARLAPSERLAELALHGLLVVLAWRGRDAAADQPLLPLRGPDVLDPNRVHPPSLTHPHTQRERERERERAKKNREVESRT